jgi:hypothetical protein
MTCCCTSPYSARRYYPYPEDDHLEEENVLIRTFGKYRSGSVLVPDDIGGLTSTKRLGVDGCLVERGSSFARKVVLTLVG